MLVVLTHRRSSGFGIAPCRDAELCGHQNVLSNATLTRPTFPGERSPKLAVTMPQIYRLSSWPACATCYICSPSVIPWAPSSSCLRSRTLQPLCSHKFLTSWLGHRLGLRNNPTNPSTLRNGLLSVSTSWTGRRLGFRSNSTNSCTTRNGSDAFNPCRRANWWN